MPTLDTTIAFLGVSLLLAFAPGPDNLFVLMQSATHGRRAGFSVVFGLCTGLMVHTSAVAFGLAAIFAASAAAFLILKFVGAAYLGYLAWQAFRAGAGDSQVPVKHASAQPHRLYVRGIVMNLTNPKVALFFLAFLPQFANPRRGPVVWQILWFGALFIVATLIAFGTITCFADFLGNRLRRSRRVQRYLNRATGTVLAALALRLAISRR
jgi:threonine/homoserine/homoserine lactone efflux protein